MNITRVEVAIIFRYDETEPEPPVPSAAIAAALERAVTSYNAPFQVLDIDDNIPQDLLDKAECVIVIPSMVKVALGIGVLIGALVRREAAWASPPADAPRGADVGGRVDRAAGARACGTATGGSRGSGDGMAAMGHGQSEPAPLEKHYPKIHPTVRDVIHKCIQPEPERRLPVERTVEFLPLLPVLPEPTIQMIFLMGVAAFFLVA